MVCHDVFVNLDHLLLRSFIVIYSKVSSQLQVGNRLMCFNLESWTRRSVTEDDWGHCKNRVLTFLFSILTFLLKPDFYLITKNRENIYFIYLFLLQWPQSPSVICTALLYVKYDGGLASCLLASSQLSLLSMKTGSRGACLFKANVLWCLHLCANRNVTWGSWVSKSPLHMDEKFQCLIIQNDRTSAFVYK